MIKKYEQYITEEVDMRNNEYFEYNLVYKNGEMKQVTRDEFVEAGAYKRMKTDKKSLLSIDHENKRIIAKFENFKIK